MFKTRENRMMTKSKKAKEAAKEPSKENTRPASDLAAKERLFAKPVRPTTTFYWDTVTTNEKEAASRVTSERASKAGRAGRPTSDSASKRPMSRGKAMTVLGLWRTRGLTERNTTELAVTQADLLAAFHREEARLQGSGTKLQDLHEGYQVLTQCLAR